MVQSIPAVLTDSRARRPHPSCVAWVRCKVRGRNKWTLYLSLALSVRTHSKRPLRSSPLTLCMSSAHVKSSQHWSSYLAALTTRPNERVGLLKAVGSPWKSIWRVWQHNIASLYVTRVCYAVYVFKLTQTIAQLPCAPALAFVVVALTPGWHLALLEPHSKRGT